MLYRYVECDCCHKKIQEDDVFYSYGNFCGIYCSSECVIKAWVSCTQHILNDEEVRNHGRTFEKN